MLKNFTNFALFQKIKTRIKKFDLEKHLVKTIIGIFAVSFVISIIGGTSTLVSSVSLPLITAIFAFLAYKYNKEKFRLELFDKRWEVYENISILCLTIQKYKRIRPMHGSTKTTYNDLRKAYDSIKKLSNEEGYHLRSLLFSNDIEDAFTKIDMAYKFLWNHYENNTDEGGEWDHYKNIVDIEKNLPELFKPYLYFGDYRND